MQDNPALEGLKYMEILLSGTWWGVLSMVDGDRPYAIPLNHAYVEGRILLHGAMEGRKLDCIRRNPDVSYLVARQDAPVQDHGPQSDVCHLDCDSVICVGQARIVEDLDERAAALNAFARFYNPEAGDLPAARVERAAAIEITITQMTGRRERGRKAVMFTHNPGDCGR